MVFQSGQITGTLADDPAAFRGTMPTRDRRVVLYGGSLILDCLALIAAYAIAMSTREAQWLQIGGHDLLLIAMPIFVMFEIAREVQSVEALASRSLGTARAIGSLFATALIVVFLTFLNKDETFSRVGLVMFVGSAVVALAVSKLILDGLVKLVLHGRTTAEILVVDGAKAPPHTGMDMVDLTSEGLWPDLSRPDYIDRLSRIISPYDRVVVACVPEHRDSWAVFLKGSEVGGEILLDHSVLFGAVGIGECGPSETLILSRGPLSLGSRLQKRTFDLALGIPLLLLLAPLMIAVAIAIRLESKGPVLFRQIRVGQGNRQFRMFKFRSMRVEASDQAGNRSASRDDERITRVGRFIRHTSIDELPQLINVLFGNMSLVGPRPHALGSLAGQELFWEVTASYWLRHALKPGITGLAQIRGFRGATVKPEDLTRRLRCDLEYVANWSIVNDLLIMLRTLRVVVHKNAF
ncbi:MAG: exopolysaccharide biosynthesis polyprenyl glycosylphosphotransferase [Proteobacteria bacterium]|nr:exopolysaccharide biosynthesis polyprenyl glycosylphosphotransferase [Pseudomonadota bacterium]